jgi:hypothetical protein
MMIFPAEDEPRWAANFQSEIVITDVQASMMKGERIENPNRVLLPNGPYRVYGAQAGT